jgi:predicted RNA-binding Zn ribbon-like protein
MTTPRTFEQLLPGEPAAVRFMNSVWADRGGVHDELRTEADLAVVLDCLDLVPEAGTSPEDVERARQLRDALRRLAAAVTEDTRARADTGLSEQVAVQRVNAALRGAGTEQLEPGDGDWHLRAEVTSVRHALAELARQGGRLVSDPARPLRACGAPGCVLYFVHNHPRREWCSPECGNRARAARHYARARERRDAHAG